MKFPLEGTTVSRRKTTLVFFFSFFFQRLFKLTWFGVKEKKNKKRKKSIMKIEKKTMVTFHTLDKTTIMEQRKKVRINCLGGFVMVDLLDKLTRPESTTRDMGREKKILTLVEGTEPNQNSFFEKVISRRQHWPDFSIHVFNSHFFLNSYR